LRATAPLLPLLIPAAFVLVCTTGGSAEAAPMALRSKDAYAA